MRIRLKRATTTSTATAKNRKDSFLSLSSDTSVTPATAPGEEGLPSYGLDVSNYQQQLELVGRTKRWRSRHDLLLY